MPVQLLGKGDQIDGLLTFTQGNHLSENPAVLIKEEIFGAQVFNGGVQRVVVQQDSAKDGALSFQIIR